MLGMMPKQAQMKDADAAFNPEEPLPYILNPFILTGTDQQNDTVSRA